MPLKIIIHRTSFKIFFHELNEEQTILMTVKRAKGQSYNSEKGF